MRRICTLFLALAVFVTAFSAFKCNDAANAERSVTAAGLDLQLALEAGGKSVVAFNSRERLSLADEKYVIGKLQAAATASNNLFETLEKFPTVDTTNKDQIIQLVGQFITTLDGIIADNQLVALDDKTLAQTRRWLFVAQAVAQGIRVAVAAVSAPTPMRQVLLSEADVQKAAKKSVRGFTDQDALLTEDIIQYAADFYVKLSQEKGKSAEWLRDQRRSVYASNLALFNQQLGRV